jgi:hypothetical protein
VPITLSWLLTWVLVLDEGVQIERLLAYIIKATGASTAS